MSFAIKVFKSNINFLNIVPDDPTIIVQNFLYNDAANGTVTITNNHSTDAFSGYIIGTHSSVDSNIMLIIHVDSPLAVGANATFPVYVRGMTMLSTLPSIQLKKAPQLTTPIIT